MRLSFDDLQDTLRAMGFSEPVPFILDESATWYWYSLIDESRQTNLNLYFYPEEGICWLYDGRKNEGDDIDPGGVYYVGIPKSVSGLHQAVSHGLGNLSRPYRNAVEVMLTNLPASIASEVEKGIRERFSQLGFNLTDREYTGLVNERCLNLILLGSDEYILYLIQSILPLQLQEICRWRKDLRITISGVPVTYALEVPHESIVEE